MMQLAFPEIEQDLSKQFSLGGQEKLSVANVSLCVTQTLAPWHARAGWG